MIVRAPSKTHHERPVRIQLSRAKGWRMPPNTVKVDRSTRWGNPWRIGSNRYDREAGWLVCVTVEDTIAAYRQSVDWDPSAPSYIGSLEVWGGYDDAIHVNQRSIRRYLAGNNLACWCRPGAPCHADVLLELANASDGAQASSDDRRPSPRDDQNTPPNQSTGGDQ